MGGEIDLGGRPYDLAMSKRTRKPSKLDETDLGSGLCPKNIAWKLFLMKGKGSLEKSWLVTVEA